VVATCVATYGNKPFSCCFTSCSHFWLELLTRKMR